MRDPVRNPPGLPRRRCVLLVLAAGGSVRLAGRPKALLEVDGEPAVRRVLNVGRSLGVDDAVVVVGRHRDAISTALGDNATKIVFNEDWERGRTGSIQAGLRAIGAEADVLLWPIDHPFVEANTVRELLATAARDRIAAWVMPTYEGRGGHPVWLAPAATRLIPPLPLDAPLRNLMPQLGVQVVRMATTDPWVRVGTDTFEEYSAAVARRRAEG